MQTHEVVNQVPPLVNVNFFEMDGVLKEALIREGGEWGLQRVRDFGAKVGSQEVITWGVEANKNLPVLRAFDPTGHRIDGVDFHPSWHSLMNLSVSQGLHSLPWIESKAGVNAVRCALYFLMTQIEAGHGCPITMTYAVVPALRANPSLAKQWEPLITSLNYDPSFKPAFQKKGVIFGMGMTEKQGGSDVRSNTTQALPDGKNGDFRLTGHKWFCSAPMNDAFLVLAQAPGGLSCFLVPRFEPDGKPNVFKIQRLKDKLGNKSNASGEIEFENTYAALVGEEGRGVATIIRMVNHTRLDCIMGSAGLMRQALVQATHHARHREAFGKKLIDQDLMGNVLADLALESEAATVLMMRLARAYDEKEKDSRAQALTRIGTAIGKYWVCKRTPNFTFEAMECLGGNGYVEEFPLARLYREAPVNSIWEGSGNVNCLDVLRALSQDIQSFGVLLEEIKKARGQNKDLDHAVSELEKNFQDRLPNEVSARHFVEKLVLAFQASLLVSHSPSFVSDAFCASRLGGRWGLAYGTLAPSVDFKSIIKRVM